MTGRRGRAWIAAVAAAMTVCSTQPIHAAASSRTVDGRVDDWHGTSSRLGGTSQYSHGELVYQDHLFDDLGADTGQRSQQHGTTGAPKGDFRYPADEKRYGDNAADILELRVAADGKSLWVLVRFSTLKVPDGTVIALAFDTDRRSATGGGPWPYSAGLSVPAVDRVVTLWGGGGTVTTLPTGRPSRLHDVAVNTSNGNNAIEARIPRAVLGGGPAVRLWAAAGLWDKAASQWMAVPSGNPSSTAPGGGSPSVTARAFNVAFRPDETGSFMEERQAAALAAGDISSFHVDVDLRALTEGRTRPFKIKAGRFYAAIVDQQLSIPPYHEGLSYDGIPGRFAGVGGAALSQHFDFYGRFQPYGLYVPSTYGHRKRIPAALVLHGLGGSHSTYNSQPGFIADMGEGDGSAQEPPMFLITPLARGSSFYADWGEADAIAVLNDVFERFSIDRRRLYLTGYSMGGYGVYRFASLHPDWFAAAAAWAGYTGEFTGAYLTSPTSLGDPTGQAQAIRGALAPLGIGGGRQGKANIGDPVDTLENLRHLALMHLAGTNDEIVPTSGQYAAPRRLAELGYRSRFDLYPGYEHFSFALIDDWKQVRAWLGNRTRTSTPRDIIFKFSDGWTAPGLTRQLGLVHGSVWWLHDLAMRKPTTDALDLASISATSWAVPARAVNVTEDFAPGSSPTPHIEQIVSWGPGRPLPTGNRVDLQLTAVGRVTIDTAGARLHPCGLTLSLRSDGRATIRLVGEFPANSRITGIRGISGRSTGESFLVNVPRSVDGSATVVCG